MAKKKIRFTNFWGDEISKRQYVDDKIRVLSEMELFSPDSIANERERVELVASSVDAVCVFSVIPKGRNFGPVGLSVFVEIESVGARLPPVGTDVSPCRNPANSGEFFFPVLAGESFLEQRDCFRDKFLSLGSEQVLNFDIVHFRYLLSGHFAHHNFHLWCLRRE